MTRRIPENAVEFYCRIIAILMRRFGCTDFKITEREIDEALDLLQHRSYGHAGEVWRFEIPGNDAPSRRQQRPSHSEVRNALDMLVRHFGHDDADMNSIDLRCEETSRERSSYSPEVLTQIRFVLRFRQWEPRHEPQAPMRYLDGFDHYGTPARMPPIPALPVPSEIATHGAPPDVGPEAMQTALEEAGLPRPAITAESIVTRLGQALAADTIRWAILGNDAPDEEAPVVARWTGMGQSFSLNLELNPEQVTHLFTWLDRRTAPPKECCRGGCTKPRQSPHAFCVTCYEDFLTLTQGNK